MDEPRRLRTLASYDVLNTPPEPNFDRITWLAATIFDLPVSVLSFADADRHWFKSRHGIDASEMSRRLSFCDVTLSGDGVFVVPDACADARFVAAPVVAEAPHFRFYAGAPLIAPNALRIGSLCVLDFRPHADFMDKQCGILANLASTVVELLDSRSRQIELARRTAETTYLARHDPLTGLPNRRHLHDHMDAVLARMQSDEEIAVLYLDLDYFKEINDQLGHAVGDLLLIQVAERLRANIRAADKVARLGGDEFAIVQIGPYAQWQAADLAKRLIFRLSEPYDVEGHRLAIGASIGISLGGKATVTTADKLITNADAALYRAKSEGRGRYCFFQTGMDRRGGHESSPHAEPALD